MVQQISPNNVGILLLFIHFKITYFCHFHRYLDFLQLLHLQLNLVESSFSGENKTSMDPLKILVTLRVPQKISH